MYHFLSCDVHCKFPLCFALSVCLSPCRPLSSPIILVDVLRFFLRQMSAYMMENPFLCGECVEQCTPFLRQYPFQPVEELSERVSEEGAMDFLGTDLLSWPLSGARGGSFLNPTLHERISSEDKVGVLCFVLDCHSGRHL